MKTFEAAHSYTSALIRCYAISNQGVPLIQDLDYLVNRSKYSFKSHKINVNDSMLMMMVKEKPQALSTEVNQFNLSHRVDIYQRDNPMTLLWFYRLMPPSLVDATWSEIRNSHPEWLKHSYDEYIWVDGVEQ
jgi:hypothetical protein